MKEYVDALERSPDRERQRALLERIIDQPREHARLINTFARMEYVGVRKMLKSRRSEALDLDGLQHILDETVHALRLKKAALAVATAAGGVGVETFATEDTLAGDAGEDYLQDVDRAAEAVLADLPEAKRAESNYVLSSAAIEVRAQAFYPLYEQCLRARERADVGGHDHEGRGSPPDRDGRPPGVAAARLALPPGAGAGGRAADASRRSCRLWQPPWTRPGSLPAPPRGSLPRSRYRARRKIRWFSLSDTNSAPSRST